MSASVCVRYWLTALIVGAWVVLDGSIALTQRGGTTQTEKAQPVNSGANPYHVIRDWAQLQAEGRPWGGSNGVAIDRDGRSVWATDRCSPGTTPGCLGAKANPVHHFDESGKEIRSFGGTMFVWGSSFERSAEPEPDPPSFGRRTRSNSIHRDGRSSRIGTIIVFRS